METVNIVAVIIAIVVALFVLQVFTKPPRHG